MRIVITGAGGQLGRALIEKAKKSAEWKQLGIELICVSKEELDISSKASVEDFFSCQTCDIVVNCAAYTNVDKAEENETEAFIVNSTGVENLARVSIKEGFRVIHISTDYVFDGISTIPYNEIDREAPATVYGKSKLAGEKILLSLNPNSIIIRTAWLYSPHGRNFFLTMRNKALAEEKVKVVNDQKGSPTSAMDLSGAIIKISAGSYWRPGVYNFTNEGATTWYEFAKEIYRMYGKDESLVEPITTKEFITKTPRPKFSVLDNSKIKATYKIAIPDWKESLRTVVESMKEV